MNVRYIEKDKLLYFDLTEEIDHHTTEEIRRKADYEIERYMPKRVIFNFNSVNFMDSSGIGLLIGRYNLLKLLNSKMTIINPSSSIRRVLELSNVAKNIEMRSI